MTLPLDLEAARKRLDEAARKTSPLFVVPLFADLSAALFEIERLRAELAEQDEAHDVCEKNSHGLYMEACDQRDEARAERDVLASRVERLEKALVDVESLAGTVCQDKSGRWLIPWTDAAAELMANIANLLARAALNTEGSEKP